MNKAIAPHTSLMLLLCLFATTATAEVTRFEIRKREPFARGKAFGTIGGYERIIGRVYFELDPDLPKNQHVIDLKLAPRNARGRVELSADLLILAPKDLSRGNHALLYGVNNRGNLNALRHFNYASGSNDPKDEKHAGDGFLMRHGFTVVWSGWDGELLPGNNRLRLFPPAVEKKITGKVRCEIVPSSDTTRTVVNWDNHGSYRPTAEGLKTATLTHRLLAGHPRVPIPRENWKLHVSDVESDSPTQLPKVELEYPQGLKKLHIYELIYEAEDPVVMGTCFTSVRDLISALKHGTGKGNPLLVDGQSPIQRAHSFGVSQSGRFLREMTYWGFNEDESGGKVFDGIIPHVSGSGMGSFNHRFAQPTRHAGQHDHHDYPPDRFPFAYGTQTDPLSSLTEGILDRSVSSGTAPLVMHTQSSSEYWNRSGSLVHTDPLGIRDAEIPDNVRLYFFGGTQHGPSGFTTKIGDGQTAPNPADYKPFLRALLLALDRWAEDGTGPPPSVYPKIRDGTLVAFTKNATGFPNIPGIRYPGVIQQPSFLDFGPRWQDERIVDNQPPIPRGDYRVLVPRSGPDGNELGCLSAPEVAVPVATYASWRLRRENGPAANQLYSLSGSYIPFPVTRAEREKSGDPRRSLEERYGTLEKYLGQLEAQCRGYEKAGYLLKEDTQRTLQVQRERVAPLFNPKTTTFAPGDNPPEVSFAAMTLEETRAYQKSVMRKIADLALIPPKLITNPGPKYDAENLDYGMTIGIARTPKGRLWAAWVAGEDGPGAFMVAATSDDDGETWSKPRLAIDSQTPGLPIPRSVIVGNLWTDPLGRLWFFFDQTMNHFDGRAGLWAAICENPDDDNPTWSKPRRLWHGVCLNKPTVTSKGEWLLPAYLLQKEHTSGIGPFKDTFPELDDFRGVNLLVSKDLGVTWERRACVKFPTPDWHEPMIVERGDGALWMLARTRRGIMETLSTDSGHTWSKPTDPPGIKHPNARFHFRRLASGRILLVKHGDQIDKHEGRVKLSAWLSDDEGQSWKGGLVLEDRRGVSYPDGFQAPDGTLYISYDRNRSTDGEVLLARFNEEDVLARKLVGPRSKLKMLISRPLARDVAKLPKFPGPTPRVPRTITIPTVDISSDTNRHSIVARGTADTYHGHCDTVLLPDGKTMFTAWTVDHAQRIGPLARSDDGGRTWSAPLDVPSNWHQTANTPAIHRLVDPQGKARLVVFADGLDWRRKGRPPYPMHQAVSEDNGKTWTSMKPNSVQGEVPPKTILSFDEGRRIVLWSDLPGYVVQSESQDGGQTWQRERRILRIPDRWGQPCVIRSPDGNQLLMLLRENSRRHHSLYSISNDNAQTWSEPRELPASLTGDRHVARYAPDGRLVVAMRDRAKTSSTYGHYVAWVGRYENIPAGREGQYRVKLLHNAARGDNDAPGEGNADCGYSDLEVLPDGTVVATTYLKYQRGPEKNSVVNTRFKLDETDALLPSK